MDESMSHVTENGLEKGREEKSLPLQDDSVEIRPNSPEEMPSHEPWQQHSVIDENAFINPSRTYALDKMIPKDGEIHKLKLKYRSQTFAYNMERPERSKTFLGIKVEQDLQRKQADRRDRREHFGDVKMKKTQLYGKLCSPFQALSVPNFVDVKIPENMPLSQRMVNKGYTSLNLTEDKLMNMDFSYDGPDTPPSAEQREEPVHKTVLGSRMSSRETKSRKTPLRNQSRNKLFTPVLKKHHTIA